MKARLIFLLCFSACLQAGWAQNSVESIRQRYNVMKEYIASHTNEDMNDGANFGEYYHIQARQWLPGTGGHLEDTFLYWDEVEEDAIYPRHFLTFVTSRYNYAARQFYEEYLYDADGNVAFVYAYDPMLEVDGDAESMEYEFRFYMNKGRLIKGIVMQKGVGQQAFKEVWQGSKLPAKYVEKHDEYMAKAKKFPSIFVNIEKVSYNY